MKKSFYITFLMMFILKAASSQTKPVQLTVYYDAFSLLSDTVIQKDIKINVAGFLNEKNNGSGRNSYIDPNYLKKNMEPFPWLTGSENYFYSSNNKTYPELLSVLPIEDNQYLIKIGYTIFQKPDTPGVAEIISLIARKSGAKYFFYNAIDHYTRFWNKRVVGTIKYIYPNQFNYKEATRMDAFNKGLAKKFDIQPLHLTYYKCEDPEQLFDIMGFDYVPNMYYSTSGGLAEYWTNTLYAGNNSELYIHETVHFYTARLFPVRSKIVDEGYATYLGGSGGASLDELAIVALKYIKNHPEQHIDALATDFSVRVDGDVPITYILSGLVCRDIELKYGINGIKTLLTPKEGEDYFTCLNRINKVSKENFKNYIETLLKRYQ